MNTNPTNDVSETQLSEPSFVAKVASQVGLSVLATISLLAAAILNPDLWIQFGIVVVLSTLNYLLLVRVNKFVSEPHQPLQAQEIVDFAMGQKSRIEILSNQAAKFWPAFAVVMAVAAVILSTGNQFNLSSALSVFAAGLLITNSQTIAITVPTAISASLKAANEAGIFIKNRLAFERAARLNLVLFTKSGLLTNSPINVSAVRLAANSKFKDEQKLLSVAASVESMSKHAFANAISETVSKSNSRVTKSVNFIEVPGYGVQGLVGGSEVFVGSIAFLIQRNIRMEVQELIYADESMKNGFSVVCVVVDGVLQGLLTFTDLVKPTSTEAIYEVARERIRVGIITGDSAGTAQSKADELNVFEVYAELSPERKAAFVAAEKSAGSKVGVITELNCDLELQSAADLSIALMGDSEELVSSADVLVRGNNPDLAAQVISLSSRLWRKTKLGLGFGLTYSVFSLVTFVAIVSPLQIPTPPAIAALIGSLSLLLVSINAHSVGKLK
jgi:Cu2+-exporting ATPase